jgi:hypothetical protein
VRADQVTASICLSCPDDGGSLFLSCEIAQPLLRYWQCHRVCCPYRLRLCLMRTAAEQPDCRCQSQQRSGCDARMCAAEAWVRQQPVGQQAMSSSMEGGAGRGACSASSCWKRVWNGEAEMWWVCLGSVHYFARISGSTPARPPGAAGSMSSSARADAVSDWISMAHSAAPRPKTYSSLTSRKGGCR